MRPLISTTNVLLSDSDLEYPEERGLGVTRRLRVTGLRLLNTVLLAGLGIVKAVLAARGQSVVPSVLDWVLGVVWAILLYWIGFVEEIRPRVWWWFLHRDYAPEVWIFFARFPGAVILAFVQGLLLPLLSALLLMLPQLLGLVLAWDRVTGPVGGFRYVFGTQISWMLCAALFRIESYRLCGLSPRSDDLSGLWRVSCLLRCWNECTLLSPRLTLM
ncbi:hypothetical protein BXZ70DRAFT_647216 [Cristinia sonorae]|uniref:Uncharacterized protein n=1 Tax=Cristinia sonorae TaxID=1940300 RepID=A0A8K0UER3_9AGAR|nr:hypothetical protein BXZ70DRAFT_647216 [Cristinia sonorae]